MPDIIFLHGLKIYAQIGDYEWEQRIKQPLLFDIELTADIATAAKTDSLKDTVNYATVAQRLTDFISNKPFLLLECLAEEVASLILQEFKVSRIKLKVSKPAILANVKEAGVIIERP